MKKQIIYYDEKENINYLATFVNNNQWILPIFFIIMFILCGILDGLGNI